MKKAVTLVEVGLRDGLQNEQVALSTDLRVEMAHKLLQAGTKRLEVGAFVRADRVPQMAGSAQVVAALLSKRKQGEIPRRSEFSVLVPNERGMRDALETGIKEVAVFAGCSESFSQKNINCGIEESFERFEPVFALAKKNKMKVRGYLSVCFGCPYEGHVPEARVVALAKRLHQAGAYEISIGDTIGVANPAQVESLFRRLKKVIPVKKLAGHFHDTRGTSLANILVAWKLGVKVFDTSLGGLGGCPYAPGASGNVATEDVAYMFEGMGVKTGLDLQKLVELNAWTSQQMGKKLPSKLGQAGLPRS